MKVKLNANWLDSGTKSKLVWIQEVRKHFDLTAAQIKPLADFFWLSTKDLMVSKELIVDTGDFDILTSLIQKHRFDDIWISHSKAIQQHYTEEKLQRINIQSNPYFLKQEQLDDEIKKLMSLIPDDKIQDAEEALKRVLMAYSLFSAPIG